MVHELNKSALVKHQVNQNSSKFLKTLSKNYQRRTKLCFFCNSFWSGKCYKNIFPEYISHMNQNTNNVEAFHTTRHTVELTLLPSSTFAEALSNLQLSWTINKTDNSFNPFTFYFKANFEMNECNKKGESLKNHNNKKQQQ